MANRNEYLQSLNRMRRNYQTGGNAVVNPSDDSTNVGEELSSFAYANTQPSKPEEPTDKDKGNILTRPIDTVESGIENVQRGLLGVVDDAFDFLVNVGAGIGKLFGADDEWAKQATQYNWVDRAIEFENLTTQMTTSLFNGKMFSGEYGEAWDNFLNSKGNDFKGVLSESQRRGSYTSDMGEAGAFIESVEQGIGAMLPALAIGDATKGLGFFGRLGVQAGMSGIESYGAGIEKAYSEGADFGKANAYGAVKGTIGASTTALLMGLGGYASSKGGEGIVGTLSSKAGDKIFKWTNSRGAQAFATAVSEALGRAGTTYATSMANQAVEPYIQSIYDNGKAIEEAYGSNEKIMQYLQRCSINAGTSALVSGIISLGREGVELATRGKEGYMAKFSLQKATNAQRKIEKELKSINKDIQNGKITEKQVEERLASLGKYSKTVEEYGKLTAEYLARTETDFEKEGQFYSVGEYKGKNNYPDFERFGASKDTAEGFYKLLKSRLQTNGNIVISEDSFVKPDESGKGGQLVLTNGDATHSIAIKEQGNSYVVNARDLLVPACSGKTMDSTKPIALAGNALSPARVRNLAEIVDKGDQNGAYVLEAKQGGEYKAVIPTEDGKFGVITVDSKTNEIKDVEVKNEITKNGYNVVPKEDADKIKTTKAVSSADGQPLFVEMSKKESWKFSKDSHQNEIRGHNDYDENGYYVYSKNPFYASDYRKALSFDKVSKAFGIPQSLKETYQLKMDAGYDKLSNYLSNFTHLKINEITDKLGYDVYIDEQKGELVTNDASNIIKGGILDGNQKGSDRDIRSIGRDARDNSIEGLRGYLGENGKEIGGIQERLDYAQKIKDGGLYKTKRISGEDYKIIESEYLTKGMRELADFGKKVGVEINYAVGYSGEKNAIGKYLPASQRIVVFTDYLKNTSIFGLTKHEICHHAFAVFLADYKHKLTSQVYAIGKKSWTVQRLIDKYRMLYEDVPFADPLEEIICQLYSGNEALPSQFSKYQNSIVNRVDELFSQGWEETSEEYYGELAEETKFSVEPKPDEEPVGGNNLTEDEKTYEVNIAPYRSVNVNSGNLNSIRGKISNSFESKLTQIAKTIGLDKFYFTDTVGGFTSQEGRYAGQNVVETGNKVAIKGANIEDVELFACLSADIGHETQEAVIVSYCVAKGEGNAIQHTIPCAKNKVDEVTKLLKMFGFNNFTYYDKQGIIKITVVPEAGDDPVDLLSNFEKFIKGAKEYGIIQQEQQITNQDIESKYLSPDGRRDAYKRGLQSERWSGNGKLRDLLEQGLARVEAELKTSPLKKEVNRLFSEEIKNVDLSKVEFENIVNNGQKKVVIKEDDNTKPLFDTARAVNQITSIEKPFAKSFLEETAKRFGIECDGKFAQSLQKSVNSIADRLYRNIKNGKGHSVYRLNDWLRTTFILNENNIDKLEELRDFLSPYMIDDGFDIADTTFGYKGVHLKLKFQDLPLELQIHSKESWAIKLQQDEIYDKWRSKDKLTPAEEKQKELDMERSRGLSKDLGTVGERIRSVAKADNYRRGVEPKDKIISDLQAKSSNVLIEAGADANKPVKYRLEALGQALTKTVQTVLGDGSKVKLIPSETKQTFAELNLARPKDRHIAIDNAVKGLLSSKVELDGERYKFGDLVTADQIERLKTLVGNNVDGISEPTKLAQWAESLQFSKLENKENIRSAKLLSAISKKIDNSLNNTYGYGDVATGELTVYKNITDGIKPFFTNKSITELADRVLVNYTEDNLDKMYDAFGIDFNPLIPQLANMIKDAVVAGRHLDPMAVQMGNDILQLIKNDLDMVARGSHDAKVKTAKANVDIAQGVFFGNDGGTKNKFLGSIQEGAGRLDASIVAPSPFVHAIVPDSPLDKHFGETASKYENIEKAKTKELLDFLFKETNGGKDITKELGKKFEFKGEKITYAYALKVLNEQRTLGDDYYKVKGAVTNANGTRGEIKYTEEDIAELKSLLPQEILDWNERFVKEGLNGKVKEFTKERYKAITKTELPTLDEQGKDWYHISRVTDKALPQKGGAKGNTPDLSFLNKRVKSVADLNFDGDLITDTENYIRKLVNTLTWYEWIQDTNVMLNQRIYGTTLNAIMQKNVIGWDEIVDLTYHQVLGLPYDNTKTLFGKILQGTVGNIAKANVLGLQTAVRTISSAPWFASHFGAKISLAGAMLSFKHGGVVNAFKRNAGIIKENSPYLKERLEGNEVISAETSQKMSSKLSKLLGTPMRITDGYIVISDFGFSCAQAQAMEEGCGDPYTDSNNKRAVQILEEAVKKSQPTNSVLNVGGFRYGQYGQVTKLTFGMYASQIQSFYTGVRNAIIDIFTANKKIKSLESSIEHHKEREDFYKKQEEEHLKDLENAEDEKAYKKAEKEVEHDRWKQEEHKQARESQEDYLKNFKAKHTGKAQFNKVMGTVSGLLGSALGYVILNRLIQILEGKKSIKDWDGIVGETAEQAVFKSIPYISTIYYAIKNDSDLSVFTIDNLNSLIDSCKGVVDAINSGNGGHITGASVNALKNIAMYFGIPAKSVWKIFNGLWYNIDKNTNLSFNEWMGYLSSNQLKSRYQEAVKKGDKATAKANLEVWAYNYSSKMSSDVIGEVYRLSQGGYTGITPIGVARTYTDENGEKRAYASTQINAFKEAYAKADREMLALIRSGTYQSLDDEYKAKAVSSLYSYYNEYARARRDGTQVSSRIGKLLEATNGDIDLAKYIAGLKEIGNVTETRRGTRKENVIKAINRMSGFTKGERLLLAYLGGYSVSEGNRQVLVSQLMRMGFDRKSALAYIS